MKEASGTWFPGPFPRQANGLFALLEEPILQPMRRLIPPVLLLCSLSACGGDGGSTPAPTPTPTPTPGANSAPAFTSATAASVLENATVAYQATATDGDNDPLAFSISGGADAARFTINGAGQLSFVSAPNFELPADADANNVYAVTLSVSDGKTSVTRDVQVTVTNSKEGIAVHRIATGLSQPVQAFRVPNSDDELYVIEKAGRIYRLNVTTGAKTLEATVTNLATDGERGLLGLTTGPRAASGGLAAYVVATAADGAVELRQYGLNAATGAFDAPATPTVILSIPHAQNNNHNGGWLEFGPDGLLYWGIGDGGGGGDPNNNAQNTSSRLGKILRLALGPGGWGPASNSFAGAGDPYVFAYGLRNPFRNAFEGNDLIIGDVGQNAVEEIDIIGIVTAGANLGWRYLEGTRAFTGTAPPGLIAPKLQYTHGSGPLQGATIIGGRVYRGIIASIDGHYFFGDYISRHVWSVPYARLLAGPLLDGAGYELRDADLAPDAGTIDMPVAFNLDRAGRFYIVDLDGEIFRVDAS
jgi:glucose/arabinose dehydrogenase